MGGRSAMPINLRRTKYIDPAVQGALVRRLVLHWVTFTTVTALFVIGLQWFEDPFASLAGTLQHAWSSYGAIVLLLTCLAPIFIYDSIKVSSRFTGPIHRLREGLKGLAGGQSVPALTFRGDDFWQELAEDFNRVADRMRRLSPRPTPPIAKTAAMRYRPARPRPRRQGVAAAEFAVCLPMLVLALLGMLDCCSMIFLKQSLAVAAYEGAHTALQVAATSDEMCKPSAPRS